MVVNNYCMTWELISDFIAFELANGATENLIRRLKCSTKSLFEFLPEGKLLTKENLVLWRKSLEAKGYSSATILNYVKYINLYLDYAGCSDIRFNKGKLKDITNMTRGFLTAIEPTGAKNRKDIVWRFRCRCGNVIELPATRFLSGNTLSCGCLNREHLKLANQYISDTSLRQSLDDEIISTRSASGYIGVTPKRNKWQAYITYKGKRYSLGVFSDIKGAVKARAVAKELVIEDAERLQELYKELHSADSELPNRNNLPEIISPDDDIANDNKGQSVAVRRANNTSGYTGVYLRKGRWEAYITYKGIRYKLGRYDLIDDAISARKEAEAILNRSSDEFLNKYS